MEAWLGTGHGIFRLRETGEASQAGHLYERASLSPGLNAGHFSSPRRGRRASSGGGFGIAEHDGTVAEWVRWKIAESTLPTKVPATKDGATEEALPLLMLTVSAVTGLSGLFAMANLVIEVVIKS